MSLGNLLSSLCCIVVLNMSTMFPLRNPFQFQTRIDSIATITLAHHKQNHFHSESHRDTTDLPTQNAPRYPTPISKDFPLIWSLLPLLALTPKTQLRSRKRNSGTSLNQTNPYVYETTTDSPLTHVNYYLYTKSEEQKYAYDGILVWPNRDPIGEWGGLNMYGFVKNCPNCYYDYLGKMGRSSKYTVSNGYFEILIVDDVSPDSTIGGPDDRDGPVTGFEVEFVPSDSCVCEGEIRVAQTIGYNGLRARSSHIDGQDDYKKGDTPDSYTDNKRSGSDSRGKGNNRTVDSPYDPFPGRTTFLIINTAICYKDDGSSEEIAYIQWSWKESTDGDDPGWVKNPPGGSDKIPANPDQNIKGGYKAPSLKTAPDKWIEITE